MKNYFIGESCLCWSLGNAIDPAISMRILATYQSLLERKAAGHLPVLDVIPCYNALAVYFDPTSTNLDHLTKTVEETLQQTESRAKPKLKNKKVTLPVCYQGEDLARVAAHNHLSQENVIALHSGARYTVAMIGFLPHFPYLIGLPEKLVTPRLDSPRLRVPPGSVAIGGAQTGIYPTKSPGGWNIIGTTDPELLEPIKPGDTVIFTRL